MILIAPDHIESGSGRLIQERTASAQAAISGKYLFDSGDIVYSKIRPYLRKATIARFQGLCSADMYPLKTRKGVESGFILPVILGHRFSIFAEGVSARTGIPKINREDLSAFSIALPPQNEQRAIATALSDVDALLSSLDALIAKKRDIKQAAMQQLLKGKTRLPGFGGEWEVKRLGDCLLSNPDYGINAPAAAYSDNLPVYIRITDIDDDGRFNPSPRVSVDSPYSGNYILQDGDVVFARTGASVGKSYRYRVQDGPLVFAGFLIRVRPNPKLLMPDFLAGSVTTKGYWNWVRLMSMRSGQPGINGNEYATLPLLLPPIEEQTAIAEVLSDMDAELAALEARRDKTRLLKQGMMQELLTGKTRLV
ncbi:restriction endonuclease subunit S [Burkholderia gladioli]|uniref:restriction endonuclease subunit S n=1 Tax=Burkholderia gladioli TaxID=28095 RepID=UPI00163F3491|nr:restriction endonuclease subunit S [Burkholderia gladioli]